MFGKTKKQFKSIREVATPPPPQTPTSPQAPEPPTVAVSQWRSQTHDAAGPLVVMYAPSDDGIGRKFWSIYLEDKDPNAPDWNPYSWKVVTTWGPEGGWERSTAREFKSHYLAVKGYRDLIRQKKRKGYSE